MDRIEIIQHCLDPARGKTYLEIGVSEGRSFFPIRASRKIAIDPNFNLHLRGHPLGSRLKRLFTLWFSQFIGARYFKVTSDEYFKRNPVGKIRIDTAFVDGSHTYDQTLRDVLNCLERLAPTGVIVVHDCNPQSASTAMPAASYNEVKRNAAPDWDGNWCGDVWKTVVYLRSARPDLNVFVLDCDFGVGIITRGNNAGALSFTRAEVEQLKYSDLEAHRQTWLNLKPAAYLHEFLRNRSA